MASRGTLAKALLLPTIALFILIFARYGWPPVAAQASVSSSLEQQAGSSPLQQYPVMDKVADKLILKYQTATCEQLWLEKSQPPKAKSPEQQEAIQLLRNDAKMRAAFLGKIATPIANKMFECGMIP